MILGKITGTVISTQMDKGIKGKKCLLIKTCNEHTEEKNNYLVALDLIGAGIGEIVIISRGSSARQTEETLKKPVDAVIIGIVDMIQKNDRITYKK